MKKLLGTTFTLFILFLELLGQSGFVSVGGDISAQSGSVSYSIGQVDYTNHTNDRISINLGNQQPFEFYVSNVDGKDLSKVLLDIYPNPFLDYLIVEFANPNNENYMLNLFSMDGKFINSHVISESNNLIKIRDITAGNYILTLSTHNNYFLGSYKLVKK